MKKGYYFGTTVDGKWWKRYRKEGFFARGNGEYRLEENCFRFRKDVSDATLDIPYDRIIGIEVGRWHAGRWGGGSPVVRIEWSKEGKILSSGFLLAGNVKEFRNIVERLRAAVSVSDTTEK